MVGKISVQYGFVLAMVAILFAAPLASAQTEVVESSLKSGNDALKSAGNTIAKNTTAERLIFWVDFCVQPGGFTPQEGGVTVTPTASGPDYVVLPTFDPVTILYPSAPNAAEQCFEKSGEWDKTFEVVDAPYGATLNIEVSFEVAPEGTQGTIIAPSAPEPAKFDGIIEDEPAPEPGQPDSGSGTGGGDGGNGDDPEAAESPAPLPMALVLTLVGFAAIRRRRA